MLSLTAVDWQWIIEHYRNRVKMHKNLRQMHEDGRIEEYASFAVGKGK